MQNKVYGCAVGKFRRLREAGKQDVTSLSTWLALESIYFLLQFSVVGAVMGAIYAKGVPAHGLR